MPGEYADEVTLFGKYAEEVTLYLIIALPAVVAAIVGYIVGYVRGRLVIKRQITQKVHRDAVRSGAAEWAADGSGAPVIRWRTPSAPAPASGSPQTSATGNTLK